MVAALITFLVYAYMHVCLFADVHEYDLEDYGKWEYVCRAKSSPSPKVFYTFYTWHS